jgi:hypothetical protein
MGATGGGKRDALLSGMGATGGGGEVAERTGSSLPIAGTTG